MKKKTIRTLAVALAAALLLEGHICLQRTILHRKGLKKIWHSLSRLLQCRMLLTMHRQGR